MTDKLSKKLAELKELLSKGMKNAGLGGPGSVKAGAVLPGISKLPKPGNNSLASKVGMPSVGQSSKKNPMKSAEQTQNKDIKDLKMKEAQAALKAKAPEMVKFEKNGQWSIQVAPEGSKNRESYQREFEKMEGDQYESAPDRTIEGATTNETYGRGSDLNIASADRPGAGVEKSGYKGYDEKDNVRRKAKNLTTETGVKAMPRVKQYGTSASVQASREAAKDKAKSKKNPVKVMTGKDIPQELRDKYEKKGKS